MIPSTIKRRLIPSKSQLKIILVLIIYTILICALWNSKSGSWILWPFKIMTVTIHELSHAFMAICTHASVKKIIVNTNQGGKTVYAGGNPYLIIPAGYIGSSLFGSLLIFCGFNVYASNIASLFILLCMGCTLFYSNGFFTFIFTTGVLIAVILLIYTKKSKAIQYFVLFLGIMSGLYSLWDIIEDLIKRHIESSDASQFAKLKGMDWISPKIWGLLWFLFSLLSVFIAIISALLIFNNKEEEQQNDNQEEDSWELLPTQHRQNNFNEDDNFGFGVV